MSRSFNPYVDGDDGDADREDAAFAKADAMHLKELTQARHQLANQITASQFMLDMLRERLDKLDAEIKEMGQ